MQIPIFLINLDSRQDRLEVMQRRLSNLNVTRIPAVLGTSLSREFRNQRRIAKHLTQSEVGVYLSHESIWRKIVHEKLPLACVMEDDVLVSKEFPRFLDQSVWTVKNFDLIKLDNWPAPPGPIALDKKCMWARDRSIHRIRSTTYSAACYLVSLDGAKKLLEASSLIQHQVDVLLFAKEGDWMQKNLVYQLTPAVASQEQHHLSNPSKSDIEQSRIGETREPDDDPVPHTFRLVWKLNREIYRPLKQAAALLQRLVNGFRSRRVDVPFA